MLKNKYMRVELLSLSNVQVRPVQSRNLALVCDLQMNDWENFCQERTTCKGFGVPTWPYPDGGRGGGGVRYAHPTDKSYIPWNFTLLT